MYERKLKNKQKCCCNERQEPLLNGFSLVLACFFRLKQAYEKEPKQASCFWFAAFGKAKIKPEGKIHQQNL